MNKCIIITTIHRPTKAFDQILSAANDWKIIVVGDLNTPHDEYTNSGRFDYLHPTYQQSTYSEYSNMVGWNTSCRRNVGFIEAYRRGADLLALIDDDNIPDNRWLKEVIAGERIKVRAFNSSHNVFDPLHVTTYPHLWHRGFPMDLVSERHDTPAEPVDMTVLVQANLWNGNPDIDAIERMIYPGNVLFDVESYYTSTAPYMPFNSQNTILHRSVIPYYALLPGVGRVDDIWGAYILERELHNKMPFVAYGPATVWQERHHHDLLKDFNGEVFAVQNCSKFLRGENVLPIWSKESYECYRRQFPE